MVKPPLPVWKLSDLREQRSAIADKAADLGGKVLELFVNDAGDHIGIARAAVAGAKDHPSRFGALCRRLTDESERLLAKPFERLTGAQRVNLSIGSVSCVREAPRHELVEVLVTAQAALRRDGLGLVAPGIGFEHAKRNHDWRGTLIEFYPATRGSGLQHRYVALDEGADGWAPRSTLDFTVVDTARRAA